MHPDLEEYSHFHSRSRLDKAINSLLGIIEGISIDGVINDHEKGFLLLWLTEHEQDIDSHPFCELAPLIQRSLEDGVLDEEERADIKWLCERLSSQDYFDKISVDLQRLHAIVGSIVADQVITEAELRGLSDWLEEHDHLKKCWPYDEIERLVVSTLRDGKIDPEEHEQLKCFFSEFINVLDEKTIRDPLVAEDGNIVGLCSVCPDIEFAGSKFCFTGVSPLYTRSQLSDMVKKLGGSAVSGLTREVEYLVICEDGNPCWAYACYGRKVEKAVKMRKSGVRVSLIHERDFLDAIQDFL